MSLIAKKLYELLPAYYRSRDSRQGEPLKALIAVMAREAGVMEDDITRLYENWFIETCDEWVVPYIGDLLGVRGLHYIENAPVFSRRAYVANTLGYRRRKGTAPVLEQLAYDTTGWRARVVEFFQLLETFQNVNHVRLHNVRTPDLRDTGQLELLDTAFDTCAHTADVRHISSGRGWHNIPNIGLFLWRLQSYPLMRAAARLVEVEDKPGGCCYTFNPLGYDSHLFNRPQTEREITHTAEEINVPGLLRRRPLYDELQARRQAAADGRTPDYIYFDTREDAKAPPVLEIFLNHSTAGVPPGEILICDLEDWHLPQPPIKAAVDPVLGRLTLAEAEDVESVQVSYAYGFSGDVGGGPYNRQESISKVLTRDVTWQAGVSKGITSDHIFDNLQKAVEEWNKQPPGSFGVIAIMDNCTYKEDLSGDDHHIKIPEGSQLLIAAADWPEKGVPGGLTGQKQRLKGQLSPVKRRPHLRGNLSVRGTAASTSHNGGTLVVDGLLVEGKVSVLRGNLGHLGISHCTLVPGLGRLGGLEVRLQNQRLKIDVTRSICGTITLVPAISKLLLDECIVDNGGGEEEAISAPDTPIELQKCTVFGSITAREMEAGNCIFKGLVDIQRRQTGCIRFSYVPAASKTPRQFRCQPQLEIKTQIEAAAENEESKTEEEIGSRVLEWLAPAFTSTRYGHHAYGQLSRTCPVLIGTGADDGAEMGVFNHLKQPQRETNLRTALDQYLRLGLEAGIIYVT